MSSELSPRLNAVAELVPACTILADIGTDHGFLPLALLRRGRIARAVCADLRAAPLASARRAFEAAGLTDRADFRLGDGTAVLAPGEVDCAVVAGMGGDTVAAILAADRAGIPRFVLQPMSKAERLRSWLSANGWGVDAWRLARDAGRLYEALLVSRRTVPDPPPFDRFGRPDPAVAPLYRDYLLEKRAAAEAVLRGESLAARSDAARAAEAGADLRALDGILNSL